MASVLIVELSRLNLTNTVWKGNELEKENENRCEKKMANEKKDEGKRRQDKREEKPERVDREREKERYFCASLGLHRTLCHVTGALHS